MIWAQIFPFVALQFFEGELKSEIEAGLIVSFTVWLSLNIAFFCTIDLAYLHTFFGTMTGPQYTVQCFKEAINDAMRWDAVFTNRISYTKTIHGVVKVWIKENIERWRSENPSWFQVDLIPDDFLPVDVLEAEGGARRKKSILSLREAVGLPPAIIEHNNNNQVQPAEEQPEMLAIEAQKSLATINNEWKKIAEQIYAMKSNNHKSNYLHITRKFDENEALFAQLIERCPRFAIILLFIMEDRFGFRVISVDWTSKMENWKEHECASVGKSVATFIRKRKTGDAAFDAWSLHYPQLNALFMDTPGLGVFLLVFFNNLLRDSIYGTVLRVSVGAFLSILDGATDIYTISTYYKSDKLTWQANAMLAMVSMSIFGQVLIVLAIYQNHPWQTKLKEILICLTFLRPAVDAYRVSTNHEDKMATVEPLKEMMINKSLEVSAKERQGNFFCSENLPFHCFAAWCREHPGLRFAVLRLVKQPRTSGEICSCVDRHFCTNHGLHVSDGFYRL